MRNKSSRKWFSTECIFYVGNRKRSIFHERRSKSYEKFSISAIFSGNRWLKNFRKKYNFRFFFSWLGTEHRMKWCWSCWKSTVQISFFSNLIDAITCYHRQFLLKIGNELEVFGSSVHLQNFLPKMPSMKFKISTPAALLLHFSWKMRIWWKIKSSKYLDKQYFVICPQFSIIRSG